MRSLRGTLQAANRIVPGVVVVALILSGAAIGLATISANAMMGITVLLVLGTAIVVFASTSNYGEAALALVAGLLTVFSVDWTPRRFIVFSGTWIVFSLAALVIASVRLAAQNEDIYLHASSSLSRDPDDTKRIEARLREIGRITPRGVLGPVETAEVLRQLAFRNLSIEMMEPALRGVGTLSLITKVDHLTTADFVADVYGVAEPEFATNFDQLLDFVYVTMRASRASPEEFVRAFDDAKRLVLTGQKGLRDLLPEIRDALDAGIPPQEMYEHLGTAA